MSDDENQESQIVSQSPSDNKFIDEITMKLMSNKASYAKYLSKTDNLKYEEQRQFKEDCSTFKNEVTAMTKDLLMCRENEYGSDVNDAFNNYARILIRHLEIKQRSDELQQEYDDNTDTMFPFESIDESENPVKYCGKMNTMDFFLKKK
jgi:hypothetical protein